MTPRAGVSGQMKRQANSAAYAPYDPRFYCGLRELIKQIDRYIACHKRYGVGRIRHGVCTLFQLSASGPTPGRHAPLSNTLRCKFTVHDAARGCLWANEPGK